MDVQEVNTLREYQTKKMGKSKELYQLDPPPDEIDIESGKMMWIIKDCKIWANSYEEAQNIYHLINP